MSLLMTSRWRQSRWRMQLDAVSVSMRSMLCGLLTSRDLVTSQPDDVIDDDVAFASHYTVLACMSVLCAFYEIYTFKAQFRPHKKNGVVCSINFHWRHWRMSSTSRGHATSHPIGQSSQRTVAFPASTPIACNLSHGHLIWRQQFNCFTLDCTRV